MSGIYVHVPYCAVRCSYCDFNTYTTAAGRSAFARSAIAELRALAPATARTVFFGGGTPTLLPAADLAAVLAEIDREPDAEVTVEANPDSVTPASLAALRDAGFTRVSIGMQNAAPHVLHALGRTHAPERPVAAAREARAAGFEHVSLDLIFGAACETDADWRATVEAALEARPDHVSAYFLTVEPGTRLAADVRRGRVPAPDEDAMARRYGLADALLGEQGLHWYEISSWARSPADRCHHNLGYWRGDDWWGIGPGAHSHVAGVRWSNVRHPAQWAARVQRGESAAEGHEVLDPEQRALERLMLTVRTRAGIPARLADPSVASSLQARGLLRAEGDRLVLTLRGRLLADLVTRELSAPKRSAIRGGTSRAKRARFPPTPTSPEVAKHDGLRALGQAHG